MLAVFTASVYAKKVTKEMVIHVLKVSNQDINDTQFWISNIYEILWRCGFLRLQKDGNASRTTGSGLYISSITIM